MRAKQFIPEAAIGTNPKRPAREGSRPARGHDPEARYTPSPAKPSRNPPGFNKQGTGVGNKLAQQTRAELAKKKQQGVAEGDIDLDSIPGLRQQPAKKQTQYHTDEPQDRIDLDSITGLNLGGSTKSKTSTRLGGAKSQGVQAPDDTKTRGIYNNFKSRVNQLLKQRGNREIDEQGIAEDGDQVKKVFKDKSGKPVGEIGIDPESSPGNGEWYVHHYATGYSVVGFDSAAEAKRELMYVHKHPDAVEGHPSTQEQGVSDNITDNDMAKAAYQDGVKIGRGSVGNNMDHYKKVWGEHFKYFNQGFLKGRNANAKTLKAFGQGDGKNEGVAEVATDYSKRRQRERDVDAGRPVAKQRQSKITDYQKKRAQDKKDMELGEAIARMEAELAEHGKASRELCKSSKPDADLGASMLASCKSQGLRARDGDKSHKLGKTAKSRVKVGGHRIKGQKYGGPLPDWS